MTYVVGEKEDGMSSKDRSRFAKILDIASSVATLLVCVWLGWATVGNWQVRAAKKPAAIEIPSTPVSLAGAHIQGMADAPAVMVEFSDFECPFCGRFVRETLPALRNEFVQTGRLAIAFRQLPLAIHSRAQRAAQGAACAGNQGRFWQMHDLLFVTPSQLSDADLAQNAALAGASAPEFRQCMAENMRQVEEDQAIAKSLGINGTPAFLFGRRKGDSVEVRSVLTGARDIGEFRKAIENAVKSPLLAIGRRHH